MSLLIKNGTIVTALDTTVGDVRCAGGTIVEIGPNLAKQAKEELIDASGQYVFPGGIDPHVHMELPFMGTISSDDFETGTAAGVAGGTTSIIDFVIPARNEDLMDALAAWHDKAAKSVSDYAFHMAVTWWGDKTAEWMQTCVEKKGNPSFNTFMAYSGAIGVDDVELIEVMKTARALNALVTVHAEHGDMVVELFVETPTKLTPRQRELLESFCAESSEGCHPEHQGFLKRAKRFWDGLGGCGEEQRPN